MNKLQIRFNDVILISAVEVFAICLTILLTVPCYAAGSGDHDFGYEDLKQLIQNRKLKSVDEIVPRLPLEFSNNFTLMRNSQSLQRSDDLNPRAILFNDTAQMVITYGGVKNQAASSNLEIMEFDKSTNSFQLHEISFTGSSAHFSDPQEIKTRCTSCHGENTHPIWFNYPEWNGAYGAGDDYLRTDNSSGASELSIYQEFRKVNAQRPAFKWLYDGHGDDPFWPYSRSYQERIDSRMPNYRLGQMLSFNWARAVAARIIKSPLFALAKYTLVFDAHYEGGSHQEDAKILTRFAPIPQDEHWTLSRAEWQKKASRAAAMYEFFDIGYGDASLNITRIPGGSTQTGTSLGAASGNSSSYIAALLAAYVRLSDPKIMEAVGQPEAYGGATSGYGTVPAGFKNAIEKSPINIPFKLDQAYLQQKSEEELKSLQHQSLQSVNTVRQNLSVSNARSYGQLLQSPVIQNSIQGAGLDVIQKVGCMNCHSGASGFAPMIHFDNPVLLTSDLDRYSAQNESLLKKLKFRISSNDPQIRMPLDGEPLSAAEQAAILNYVNSLTSRN